MTSIRGPEVPLPTPREAAQNSLRDRPDSELPMIAAHWLADGLDSLELRELGGMSPNDQVEARRLLPAALKSIGFPVVDRDAPWEDLPWRGYWGQILWAIREVDYKLSTLAAAQHVLEVLSDVPELWTPGHGTELEQLVIDWDARPELRGQLDQRIRLLLASLSADNVPPLRPGSDIA